jgi:hypothetical protein
LALFSQGIQLKMTGHSVSLRHLPKRHISAVAYIINRHGTPAKERAPDFTAIHCLTEMIQVRFRGHYPIKPIGSQFRYRTQQQTRVGMKRGRQN